MLPNFFGGDVDNQTILIILAIAAFILVTFNRLKKIEKDEKIITRILVICSISGLCMFIGARFFDDLWHNIDDGFFKNFATLVSEEGFFKALSSWGSYGITYLGGFYGAFFGYVISYWFIMKTRRHLMFYYLDNLVIGIVLAHSIGRLGCFLSGCCYGIAAPFPFGVIFKYNADAPDYAVLPTNLYESIFLLGLFFILMFAIKKNQTRYYMVIYGTFRFLLEFLRGDSRGSSPISWLTPSQLLSLIMLIAGICLFIWGDKLNSYIEKKWTRQPKN